MRDAQIEAIKRVDYGRKFIHCDININSIQTARDRLKAAGAQFDIREIKDGVSLYRNPAQTMTKLMSLLPGLGRDGSLSSLQECSRSRMWRRL